MVSFPWEMEIRKGYREVGKTAQAFCMGGVTEVVVGGACTKWERDRP